MADARKIQSIVYATCVLSGTIIGVGLFSLPYLTLQVGWFVILLYFLIIGGLVALLHVLFGELVLKTPDHRRLPGIAEYYWGQGGKRLALATHIGALLGSILAYIIVGGGFLAELIGLSGIDLSLGAAVILFTAAGGLIMMLGNSALNKIQFIGIIGFGLVMASLAWMGRHEISGANIFARNGDAVSWFVPYGAVIFSFWGVALVPQVEDILGRYKRSMSFVVLTATALPALVYFAFIAIVLGISGPETSPSALLSLGGRLGSRAEAIILVFGLITTFTSFVAIGLTLAQVLLFDLKIRKTRTWAIVLGLPPILFFSGIKDFLGLIVFMGAVLFALDGINILLMYRRGLPGARPWKRLAAVLLIFMLMGGIAYEFLSMFKDKAG